MTDDSPHFDVSLEQSDERDENALSPARFSLSSLMLAVTLVSLICGLSIAIPSLAVLLTCLTLVAWARTFVRVRHQTASDQLPHFASTSLFAESFNVAILIAIAACFLFLFSAFVSAAALDVPMIGPCGPSMEQAAIVFIVAGLITAAGAAALLLTCSKKLPISCLTPGERILLGASSMVSVALGAGYLFFALSQI